MDKRKTYTFRLTEEESKQIDAIRAVANCSRSDLVSLFLKSAMLGWQFAEQHSAEKGGQPSDAQI